MRTRLIVASTTAALAWFGLAGCGSDHDGEVAKDPASSTPSAGTSTTIEPSSPGPTEPAGSTGPAGAPGMVAAPLYFVGDTPRGPRLYREFREVEDDNPLAEALALLVAGDVLDHDYRTLLSGLDVEGVEHADGFITVTAGEDSVLADKTVTPQQGRLAVQQLVYTLQGVEQSTDPVRVVGSDGSTGLAVFGVDTTDGVRAAPQLKVLALVNITAPEQGAEVTDDTLTASGVSSSFEATTGWWILDAEGQRVLEGSAMADGWEDHLHPWSTDIDVSGLAPGDYTFVSATDDPTGGEGPGPDRDTKDFRIG